MGISGLVIGGEAVPKVPSSTVVDGKAPPSVAHCCRSIQALRTLRKGLE